VILDHLPVLQIAIPLLLAPICVIFRNNAVAWLLALAGSVFALFSAGLLLIQVTNSGPVHYAVGGWQPPWGVALHIDAISAFVLCLVSMIAVIVTFWSRRSILSEIGADQISLYYCMFLLFLTGTLGIVSTGDAFNMFVFLEISSLASYVLISLGRDRRALTSSFQYLVMGTIGATFILIAIGLMYMMTGTLNIADLANRLPALLETTTVRAAFAFLTVGISLKMALLPLHQWLPNAYTHAPSAVSAFLAAISTKVSLYVLIRFVYSVFGSPFVFDELKLHLVFLPLSIVAILGASAIAFLQNDLKRLLAYSSIAQMGYLTLGIAINNQAGLTATVVHMFNHATIKAALFLAVGGLCLRIGSTRFDRLKGAGHHMPWTMGALVLGGCGLIGVPLTAGFVSKWYLVIAALQNDAWFVIAVILAGSLVAAAYVWRMIEVLYLQPADGPGEFREAPASMLVPTWTLILISLWLGVDTRFSVGFAEQAAASLMAAVP
jgi:multicomponent Na+:H+ antiporter subunit D